MRLCSVVWVAQGLLAKAFLAQKPGSAHRLRTQLETLKTYKGGKMRDYSSHIRHSGSSPGDRGKRGRLAFRKASPAKAPASTVLYAPTLMQRMLLKRSLSVTFYMH